MKCLLFILVFITLGNFTNAQTLNNAYNYKKGQTNVSPISFENSLVQGKLSLLKTFTKEGNGTNFLLSYDVVSYTDSSLLNKGKPFPVKLTQQSFDALFTSTTPKLAAKLVSVKKYVTDNKLSLNDEKGWIAALTYYNSLN